MNQRISTKIKEWIIHKLGGSTKPEITARCVPQFRYVGEAPQLFVSQHLYTVNSYDDKDIAEKHAKNELLMRLAEGLEEAGYVQYEIFDCENDAKCVRAYIWVVKKS